jgi:hypothetical protein
MQHNTTHKRVVLPPSNNNTSTSAEGLNPQRLRRKQTARDTNTTATSQWMPSESDDDVACSGTDQSQNTTFHRTIHSQRSTAADVGTHRGRKERGRGINVLPAKERMNLLSRLSGRGRKRSSEKTRTAISKSRRILDSSRSVSSRTSGHHSKECLSDVQESLLEISEKEDEESDEDSTLPTPSYVSTCLQRSSHTDGYQYEQHVILTREQRDEKEREEEEYDLEQMDEQNEGEAGHNLEQIDAPTQRSVPFRSGDLCIPIHGLENTAEVFNPESQYCFLCTTSKESSKLLEAAGNVVEAGTYGAVDRHRLRLQRIARCQDYEKLLSMITDNVGRMDEDCLIRAVQSFYESTLRQYVPGKPHWSIRVIREHIREHELNPQWQAWTSASDLRTLIRINLNNGVCTNNSAEGTAQKLDIPSVKLHIQLLRQLEREVAKAVSSTS